MIHKREEKSVIFITSARCKNGYSFGITAKTLLGQVITKTT